MLPTHKVLEEVLCERVCSWGTKPFWDGNSEGQVSSEKVSPLTLGRRGRVRGSSGKAARTKGKFTFYVLIPFMMIFSCVEYPILVVLGRLVVYC